MTRPFAFRLERLLGVRRLREDLASRDLGLARRAVEEENRVILGLLDDLERAKESRRALQAASEVDLLQLRLHQDYQAAVERRLSDASRRLEDLVRAEADRRRAQVEARKGVRVLERFRERRLEEHGRTEGRREQRSLDEAARTTAPEAP
jgi:flagellar export protein FliJ